MRDRCPQHGIALADDGKCVLCRRTSRPTTSELYGGSRDRGGPPAILVALAGALAVAAVAAAIAVVTRSSHEPVPITSEPGARGTSSSAASAPVVEPSSASSTASAEAPTGAPVASVRWVSEPLPEEAQPAADVERARLLERQQQAEFEAWAHREANREIEEQEARARRNRAEAEPGGRGAKATRADMFRGIPITMYSATWCGACSAARAFLQGAQIPFTERDVDTDPSAAAEARRLNPRGSIPTIDVAGTTIVGFSPSAILAAIENAARRRRVD